MSTAPETHEHPAPGATAGAAPSRGEPGPGTARAKGAEPSTARAKGAEPGTSSAARLAAIRDLLDAPNLAHFATLMPDGRPTSVPLWVGLEGDRLAVLTIPDSIKDRNIRRDPRVALSLIPADDPYRMGSIRGRVAERIEGERAWPIIDRIAEKYTGAPYPERSNRVVFLIEVEVAWSASF